MKYFVLCVLLFGYAKASLDTLGEEVLQALEQCKQEGHIYEPFSEMVMEDTFPEDNDQFTKVLVCFWKKLTILTEDGDVNYNTVRKWTPVYVVKELGSEVDAEKISDEAMDFCKDVPEADLKHLRGIRYHNCVTKYITQLA